MGFFEDIEIGERRDLGSLTFTAELIKKFAVQFDPQRFHLDEEEGRNSLFGGLAASGWHVGSVCMKLLVADGQREAREAAARGEKVAVWGPSPGNQAVVFDAAGVGHPAGPQHRHQPARRTGIFVPRDRLCAAAQSRLSRPHILDVATGAAAALCAEPSTLLSGDDARWLPNRFFIFVQVRNLWNDFFANAF
jgi:hypothetical protein